MIKKVTEELAHGSVMISAKAIDALYGQDIWEILRKHAQNYYAGKDGPSTIVDPKGTVTFFIADKGDEIMIATTAGGLTIISLKDEVTQESWKGF